MAGWLDEERAALLSRIQKYEAGEVRLEEMRNARRIDVTAEKLLEFRQRLCQLEELLGTVESSEEQES